MEHFSPEWKGSTTMSEAELKRALKDLEAEVTNRVQSLAVAIERRASRSEDEARAVVDVLKNLKDGTEKLIVSLARSILPEITFKQTERAFTKFFYSISYGSAKPVPGLDVYEDGKWVGFLAHTGTIRWRPRSEWWFFAGPLTPSGKMGAAMIRTSEIRAMDFAEAEEVLKLKLNDENLAAALERLGVFNMSGWALEDDEEYDDGMFDGYGF